MSHFLSERNIDHLVFECGDVADRWKNTTWDSLRLLTPNWMNCLPGTPYAGQEPDGFMARDDLVGYLEGYSSSNRVPVVCRTRVRALSVFGGWYSLLTDRGAWRARAVVIATGQCDIPFIPAVASGAPSDVHSIHSSQYRRPEDLPSGNVLVVGASSSGVQIADELARSGRAVTLAVGKHIRLPRRWAGKDIFRCFQQTGKLAQRTCDIRNLAEARRQPSLQLVGRPDGQNIDLASLQSLGVRLSGRLRAINGDVVHFADDLALHIEAAERKQTRLLEEFAAFDRGGLARNLAMPEPVEIAPHSDPRNISLTEDGIRAIVWATGFKRRFDWIDLPIIDDTGDISHTDGVTPMPGVYALGFRLLRKRDSNFIGGVGADAEALSGHLSQYLEQTSRSAA